jgi:hypothetical protein
MIGANDIEGLKRLLQAIDDPMNVFVVHVDGKLGTDGVQNATSMVPDEMKNRTKVISREHVMWGGSSILRAYIQGIKEAVSMGSWSYVINLSGSDYPLFSQREIKRFLAEYGNNRGMSFLDFGRTGAGTMHVPTWLVDPTAAANGVATELSDDDILNKIHRISGVVSECKEDGNVYATASLRKLPGDIDWREGSFWHILHRSFIDSMFTGLDRELTGKFLEYFDVLSNPDETFFQTVLLNSNECLNVCNTNLRFENWHPDINAMHPMPMSMDDVDAALRDTVLKENLRLFARKFQNGDGGQDVKNYVDLLRRTTTIPNDL